MQSHDCSCLNRRRYLPRERFGEVAPASQFSKHQGGGDGLRFCRVLLSCALVWGWTVLAFPQASPSSAVDSTPVRQIDLAKLGYQGLSSESRLMTTANVTVNFLDDNHLLLTFNPKKLFQRDPACPPSHKDRSIQAEVIELASGRVVRQASWYLHDEHRYLWPLGDGHFLLRKLNSLYQVDQELHEKLLLESPKPLLWTGVTPDGRQIMVETAVDDSGKVRNAAKAKVKIDFLDVKSLAVQRTIQVSQVLPLEATSLGFGDAVRGMSGKIWLVRFGSGFKDRSYITRVKSRCVPDLLFPTNNTMFVGRCSAEGSDYSVSIFTLTGHFLWREKWSQHRYEPAIERSEDGSRVAISTLVGAADDGALLKEEEEWPQVQQSFRVVDAASGTPVLSTKAGSAILKGQNFALSPTGNQFAVLDGSILRVFDLPGMSTEERVKYVALQADAPTLATPAARSSAEGSNDSDEVFDVAEQNNSEEPPKAPPVAAPGSSQADASAPVIAQQAAGPKPDSTGADITDSSVVTFKVASKTVVVDVVVTDSKGHTVKGLRGEDFQVQEDGKPERVNYFHEFVGYDATNGSSGAGPFETAPSPADKLPTNVFTNNQLTREDEPVTVVLFDLLNTPPENQAFAREQLITVLKSKPPGSQFALCTLAGHLQLIQGFTSDEKLLIATANGKKGATHYNSLMERDLGLDKGLQMQKEIAAVDPNMQFVVQVFQQAEAEQRAQELDMRVNLTVDAFAQLARYLSGVPGRKSVIWLSASFPLGIFPNNDLFDAFSESRNYTALLKKTANLLAEAHVSVYPVDVRGLTTQAAFAASTLLNPTVGGPGSATPVPAAAGNAGAIANIASNAAQTTPMQQATHESLEAEVGEQSTMDQIASDTGGKAFYNTNGIKEAIQAAAEQGSNYYMLSYTPANHNYDGKFRKLKVTLAAKGYRMAYRHGYYADDPFAPITEEKDALARDVGMAAMQHGSPQSHQIVFATRVVPVGKPVKVDPTKQAGGKRPKKNAIVITEVQHYAVDYAIAAPQLHFVEQGNMHHGVLAFMASTFDDDGKALSRVASRTTSDLKASSYKDVMVGGFRVHQEFDVPVNAVSLRLGVEDELNRRLGTVEISLPVPQPPQEAGLRTKALPDIEPD
jgi:VWFA-related protein